MSLIFLTGIEIIGSMEELDMSIITLEPGEQRRVIGKVIAPTSPGAMTVSSEAISASCTVETLQEGVVPTFLFPVNIDPLPFITAYRPLCFVFLVCNNTPYRQKCTYVSLIDGIAVSDSVSYLNARQTMDRHLPCYVRPVLTEGEYTLSIVLKGDVTDIGPQPTNTLQFNAVLPFPTNIFSYTGIELLWGSDSPYTSIFSVDTANTWCRPPIFSISVTKGAQGEWWLSLVSDGASIFQPCWYYHFRDPINYLLIQGQTHLTGGGSSIGDYFPCINAIYESYASYPPVDIGGSLVSETLAPSVPRSLMAAYPLSEGWYPVRHGQYLSGDPYNYDPYIVTDGWDVCRLYPGKYHVLLNNRSHGEPGDPGEIQSVYKIGELDAP